MSKKDPPRREVPDFFKRFMVGIPTIRPTPSRVKYRNGLGPLSHSLDGYSADEIEAVAHDSAPTQPQEE